MDRVDLVFQGGGVKGMGLVGGLAILEEAGYEAANRAGTSAGAIVAVLHAAGYSAKELHDIVLAMDFEAFRDKSWEDQIPIAGPAISVLKDQGIYEGNAFLKWFRALLAAKNVTTFKDLIHDEFKDDPRYRYKVSVVASDITAHRMLVLPQDARKIGIEPDDLDVALAVRMSMSIPVFFEPVRVHVDGVEHLIVDGGMLSNFPVWLFDTDGAKPEWPTFGLMLTDPAPRTPLAERIGPAEEHHGPIDNTIEYIKDLASTAVEAHDRYYLEHQDFVRTIAISTLGVRTTDFGLKDDRKEALYESGRQAAERFLEGWDFAGYVARFRAGAPAPTRRETVEAQMARAKAGGPQV